MKNKLKVAAYLRVSHEDQKIKGDSIAAQRQHYKNFIDGNPNMIFIDEYCDEGISADKLTKRKELQRLLEDVKNKKIDLIVFTKLDRWFRSVAKYYKIQAILEENNVYWKALLEDYETLTANGRFKVNIMLSVAEQERDRTSERIKDVFEYKISQRQAIVGTNSLAFPFTIKEIDGIKKVVHNPETEAMTYDWINYLKTYKSKRGSTVYLNEKYGTNFDYQTISNLSKNTLLCGCYRGIEDYAPKYMTKEEFDEMQELLKNNVKERKSTHIHLFSRIVVCPCCGSKLIGCAYRYKYRKTGIASIKNTLRCENRYRTNKHCDFKKTIYEEKIEEYLLENLNKYIKNYLSSFDLIDKKKEKVNKTKQRKNIKDEMERLNIMFQKNRITLEQYDHDYEELEKKLNNLKDEQPKKDLSKLKELLKYDYIEVYKKSKKEDKKAFWSTIIKDICIDEEGKITDIIFW